jgi:hypothetical protein
MVRRILIMCAALGLSGSAAPAAVSYSFEAGQSTYNAAPGSLVQIPIYLKETLTDGSTSQIDADGGMYSFGITVDLTSGGGQIQNLVGNPQFDDRNGGTTSFPADPATLWADQDGLLFGTGVDRDATTGRVLLATLSFLAPASGSASLNIGDYPVTGDQTVSYAGRIFDAVTAPGNFTVNTAVPEPTGALLLLAPVAALLRRRPRGC